MNYRDAYNYLESFTNYERMRGVNYAANLEGLTRVDLLMRLLHDPHERFKSVIVAGTKGKGSVAAMVESILREGGHRTGLYTSPHLHTFRERIRVNGEMIPPAEMARIVDERIVSAVDRIKALGVPTLLPSYYEIATAIAFLYFQDQGVEIAVLEVGLGGRLDAVNIARPLVSVITPISLDHTQVLGNNITEIAEEKAGVIKKGGRVISAPQSDEAMTVVMRAAAAKRARLDVVSKDVYISTHHLPEVVYDEEGIPIYQAFTLAFQAEGEQPSGRMRVKLPLLGSHQQLNAAVALAVVRTLAASGVEIDRGAILRGFGNVQWPGRLEIARRKPVVVLDGAHNADSMAKLNQAMHDLFYGHKLVVVLGIMGDKDLEGIISEMGTSNESVVGPRVEKVIVARLRHPRAAYPTEVAEVARRKGLFVEIRESVGEAIMTAVGSARAGSQDGESDPVVLVTGSLYTVAEAREHLNLAPDTSEEEGG
jgi:dihydrofolate synthase / folylpolyglutamate synthase